MPKAPPKPPPFQLNRSERARVGAVIYDERKTKTGEKIKLDSVDKTLRRYDSGETRPGRDSPKTKEILAYIYDTDGLVLAAETDVDSPYCEAEITMEDVADDAFAARRQAAAILKGGELVAAFHRGETPPGCDTTVEESEEMWAGVPVQVEIERVDAGGEYEDYDLDNGRQSTFKVKRLVEVYLLWVSRIWVAK